MILVAEYITWGLKNLNRVPLEGSIRVAVRDLKGIYSIGFL